MLDHQEFQSEDDPPDTSSDKPSRYHAHAHSDLKTASWSTQPPKPPSSEPPAPDNSDHWWKDRKFVLEVLGFLVLFAYTWFACLQWLQIRYTNTLTARALDGSDKTLDETLRKMQGQTDATNNLYAEAKKQTADSDIVAANSAIQSESGKRGANAAKSAADTAKQTLRISERAFVTTDAPTLDFRSRYVTIGMPNSGHMPSGAVGTVIHEATGSSATPLRPGEYVPFIEKHWSGGYAPSVPPGKPFSLTVSIPRVIPEQISAGLQTVFIAGTLTYSDGFVEDGPQTWSFCWVSRYIANTTEVLWTPCDPSQYLPVLTKEDKYPNEEYQLK